MLVPWPKIEVVLTHRDLKSFPSAHTFESLQIHFSYSCDIILFTHNVILDCKNLLPLPLWVSFKYCYKLYYQVLDW